MNYLFDRSGLQAQLSGERLGEVLEQLRRCPAGLDSTLAATLRLAKKIMCMNGLNRSTTPGLID